MLLKSNNHQEDKQETNLAPDVHVNTFLTCHWYEKVTVPKDLLYVQTSCVVNDQLKTKTDFKRNPGEKEFAYLEEVEILPLLALVDALDTLGDLIYKWTRIMSVEQAKRLAVGLWNLQVICRADL